jgi:hypothetical protein
LATLFFIAAGVRSPIITPFASAHRSGCHRWHSCPSDSGSYSCGDTGHTSGCSVPTPTTPKVSVASTTLATKSGPSTPPSTARVITPRPPTSINSSPAWSTSSSFWAEYYSCQLFSKLSGQGNQVSKWFRAVPLDGSVLILGSLVELSQGSISAEVFAESGGSKSQNGWVGLLVNTYAGADPGNISVMTARSTTDRYRLNVSATSKWTIQLFSCFS